jgi:phosphoglycerate kinase
MKSIKTVKNLVGKRVLVRVDFNVALDEKGQILDDEAYKVSATLPTIKYLIAKKAQVILMTHLGRPKGIDKKLSVKPVGKFLGELLRKEIRIAEIKKVGELKNGEVVMLENLRFNPGEEKNDVKFAKELAELGDIYVNDGFGVAHRATASNVAITKFLPSYAGLLLEQEVKVLSLIKTKPKKPLLVIMGGVKFETKLPVIQKLLPKANWLMLGGALANTCYKALGYGVGASLLDADYIKLAKTIAKNKKVLLPLDMIVGRVDRNVCDYHHLPRPTKPTKLVSSPMEILDIGPETVAEWSKLIKKAQTVIWNGPMGNFEHKPFDHGTMAIARLVATRSRGPAYGIVGGGETIAALRRTKMSDFVDFVSTGGGAMLEYLAGKRLPGIEALK